MTKHLHRVDLWIFLD